MSINVCVIFECTVHYPLTQSDWSCCLSINAGLNTPFREKGNLTFKAMLSCLLLPDLGRSAFLRNKHFTSTVRKKSPWVIIQKNRVDPQKQQCVTAAALWLLFHPFGRGQNLNVEGKLLIRRTAPLHPSLYFHDFPPCGNIWILCVAHMSCHAVKPVWLW